ncbi:MAG: hypothetical protein QXS96_01705 [Candidatus Caldarchaeum sp.]|uniref:Zinc ribbon domain-containing protein n=1 Tax=Caldiarchaeum subterraneum TaxID=311458 RepID=A0A7C4I124_CALS0
MKQVKSVAAIVAFLVALSSLVAVSAQGALPPYIQPGLVFVYQLRDGQKQQLENAFHKYVIESVSPQGVTIAIVSDVAQSGRLTVNANGEFKPGERIDLWIPQGVSAGTRFKMMGVDAVVAQTGYEMQNFKVTIVVSADQSILWVFNEDGPPPYNQLKGLLLLVIFSSNGKALVLVNIEQAGAVTTTSTYSTTTRAATTRPVTTTRTQVTEGRTETVVETQTVTETTIVTKTVETVQTYTTTTTSSVSVQAENPPPVIPLTVAIPIAAVIVGGGLFYIRSRRRPLPPTYPYPAYPPPPPTSGYTPQPPRQVIAPAAYCPACRFPIYPGEYMCRRCGFRVA